LQKKENIRTKVSTARTRQVSKEGAAAPESNPSLQGKRATYSPKISGRKEQNENGRERIKEEEKRREPKRLTNSEM